MVRNIVIIVCVFLLAAAQSRADSPKAGDIVRDADWSQVKAVTVSMEEFNFTPSLLQFKSGEPYKLTIQNAGREKHYFVSEGFFNAIALRKVETRDGEIKAPILTAIEVFPGRSIDLYFVPVTKDTYSLTCTIKGHAGKGMTGQVVIR